MQGVSLLEVLISLVVLSIGLLGVAGMQYQGSDSTSSAYFRSQATIIANELAERMHANILAVNDNAFESVGILDPTNYIDTTVLDVSCDTTQANTADICDTDQLAEFDIYHTTSMIQGLLPGGSLSVTCDDMDSLDLDDCTDGSPHFIKVAWADKSKGKAIELDVELKVAP